jgi:starch synthase
MKAGLVSADQLTTVSPQYASEIMTPEFGEGLEGVVRQRVGNLSGILNGVDYTQWRTTGNPHLHFDYSTQDLFGKNRNKAALLGELGLPCKRKMPPLYAYVGRLADQKGVDLILKTIPRWLTKSGRMFVLLGNGDPRLESKFRQMQKDFPNSVCCHIGYHEPMAHLIEAAADFFLMPSRFEPCGLNQLYSLRYGTIPIVNDVGGLSDTVIDVTKNPRIGNGIKLTEHSPEGLLRALHASAKLYSNRDRLNRIRKRAMRANFDWNHSAKAYLRLYKSSHKRR